MNPEDKWRAVEELFHVAVGLPIEGRRSFLEHACKDRPEILIEVSSLLANHFPGNDLIPDLQVEKARGAVVLESPRFMAGQVIDEYEIVSLLGSGGMGEVYLAHDLRLARKVAIKVLTRLHSSDSSLLHRLKSEAQAASRLNHPNILTIHAFGLTHGVHYIVSEFVDGIRMRELIGKLSISDAINYALQIGNALRAAHQARIIHRDIKPENIMVRNDGYVKVLDFGLARSVTPDDGVTSNLPKMTRVDTATGVVLGTVSYMSPEQVRGRGLDARTDIWSWGVVLYESITGNAPFQGTSVGELISSIIERKPALPSTSKKLNNILARSLEKEPEQRYQTMDEALRDLAHLRKTAAATLDSILPRTVTGRDRLGRHSRHLAWIVLGILLLVAAAFIWRLYSARSYQVLSTARITTRGDVSAVALSTDGTRIAYAAEEGATGSLHLLEFGTNIDAERVAHYEGHNIGITFSPDGKFIFYVLHRGGNGTLYRVPFVGGEPKEILDDIDSPISFSPDGSHFAFERSDPANKLGLILIGNLQKVSVAAKVPFPLIFLGTLDWSPDGNSILFGVFDDSVSGTQKLKFGAFFPRDSRIEYGRPSGWVWIGTHVALSSDRVLVPGKAANQDPIHLYEVEWRTGEFRALTHDAVEYDGLSQATDHMTVAAVQLITESNLWLLTNGTATRLTPPNGNYQGVSWTHDGKVLVGSEVNGNRNLWSIDKDTRRMVPVTEGPYFDTYPSTAVNGAAIVFTSERDGSYHVWRASVDGRNPRRLTRGSQLEMDPDLSPNGETVIFSSDRDGIMKLWQVSVDGGEPSKLSDYPARHPSISPDGRLIACEYSDRPGGAWSVGVLDARDGRVKFRFPQIPTSDPDTSDQSKLVRWSPNGLRLVYVVTKNGVSNLWEQSLIGSPPRQMTSFSEGRIIDFAPSRDGKSIAYIKGNRGGDVALIRGLYH
jgi:serine/threonine protein kinase/Tol biopolymer transport system component